MSTAHPSLFGDELVVTSAERALVRSKHTRPLTKTEQAFNRLLRKVQMLQTRLETERRRLDDALVFHAAHVRPRITRVVALRKEVVRTLSPFLNDKRLSRGDRRVLASVLTDQLTDILMHDDAPDEDLRELFERLHGITYEQAAQEQLEDARSEMAAMFADLGVDVDVPELRLDMTEEEIMATVAGMTARLLQNAREAGVHRPDKARRKRDERAAARARRFEEARKAGIGAVYKRLVRELHPDREPDADVRMRKDAMMQEVTAAYGRHDLPALLRIESEWVDREQAAAGVADETLTAYVEVLKEQAAQLETECDALRFHPRYAPLLVEDAIFGDLVPLDGPAEVRRLDALIESLRGAVERLTTGQRWREVRAIVREYRNAQPY
jgi:hypothetical protein